MNKYLEKLAAGYGQVISGQNSAAGAQTAADQAASLPGGGGGGKPRGASSAGGSMPSPTVSGASMRMQGNMKGGNNFGMSTGDDHSMSGGFK